jgi:hypothetical protein
MACSDVCRYPGNVNLSFAYVEGESLIMGLKVGVGFALDGICLCLLGGLGCVDPFVWDRAMGGSGQVSQGSTAAFEALKCGPYMLQQHD